MSKTIIKFPHKNCTKPKPSRRSVFFLGNHTYAGGPGSCWSTRYWIKRLRDNRHFEIYCTTEDTGARRVYFDTLTADGAQEYFDSVGFEICDALAFEIGIRKPVTVDAEVLHLADYKAP
ncbi:MAG: hypothetical protein EB015_12590 [Methylocystaceae bacterium]|nr:hypothetical protein [Methylocystaceae bacterium]